MPRILNPRPGRARLYFNKLKCNEVDGSLRTAALLFEYPSAMLCGESVLHTAGWITQIPARHSVAVISRPSYVSLHGFDIHGRPLSWFKKIHPSVDLSLDKRIHGLRTLPTPLALADLYGDPKGWHPDVDDLDIPQEEVASVGAAQRYSVSNCRHRWDIRTTRRRRSSILSRSRTAASRSGRRSRRFKSCHPDH
jgi:hypothetical protein